MQECADATACYSRAWKLGLATLDVFYVKPEQVSKEPNPGEYVAKGAFIIRGKTNYLQPELKLAISVSNSKIIAGPVSAVKSYLRDSGIEGGKPMSINNRAILPY